MTDGWYKTDRGWRKSYGPPKSEVTARSDLACPRFISDTMDETQHIDGKHYTSKSAFRAVTKANGMIELGNDPARLRPVEPPKPNKAERRNSINKAISQVLGD